MKITVWHPSIPADPSADEADSLAQALAVWEALVELGSDATPLAFDLADLPGSIETLLIGQPDIVFNLVEETGGKSSLNCLPAQILEALDLGFTGNTAEAMALTTHKIATKALLANHDLPTPDWLVDGLRDTGKGDGPYLVKPVSGDASQGIIESDLGLYENRDTARDALQQRAGSNGNGWFAERYIDGREFNISLLEIDGEPVVLPVAEMCFVDYPPTKPRIVGYLAKWDPESFEHAHTCRRFELPQKDATLVERLRELSLECWRLFHLRGYARVDFRVDKDGDPWILEINTNPGIAPDAGLPAAAAAAGFDYRNLVDRIVCAAHTP